jgi:hypothetical protein
MTEDQKTSATLLLDLNEQMGNMRESIGKLLEGLTNVGERQRDNLQAIAEIQNDITSIEGRLAVGSERHRDFAKSLDTVDVRTAAMQVELVKFGPVAVAVADMEPKVKDLVEFKGRMAAILLVSSSIVGFAMWFIWEGVKWIFPDVGKELFHKLFH